MSCRYTLSEESEPFFDESVNCKPNKKGREVNRQKVPLRHENQNVTGRDGFGATYWSIAVRSCTKRGRVGGYGIVRFCDRVSMRFKVREMMNGITSHVKLRRASLSRRRANEWRQERRAQDERLYNRTRGTVVRNEKRK